MRLSKIYVPLTFAVIAASFILTSGWNFGLGVSPDSVSYISTADSLSQGEGLRTFSGPFVSWPPLTPLSLYLGKALSGSALHSATWLNSIWVFLTVFLSLWIFIKQNTNRWLILGLGSLLAFSPQLFHVNTYVWSEPLFLALLATGFLYGLKYLETHDKKALAIAGLLTASLLLTRYIGIAYFLGLSVSILLQTKRPFQTRLASVLLYSTTSLVPLVLWVSRSYLLFGTFTGHRPPSDVGYSKALKQLIVTFVNWFPPLHYLPYTIALVAVAAGTAIVVKVALKNKDEKSYPLFLLSFLFCAFYCAVLVYLRANSAMDHIATRLLVPIYIPSLVCLYLTVQWTQSKKLTMGLLGASAFLSFGYGLPKIASEVALFTTSGVPGLTSHDFRKDHFLQSLRQLQIDGPIFSNSPDCLYIHANWKAKQLPRQGYYHSPQPANEPIAAIFKPETPVYIAWIDRVQKGFLYPKSNYLDTLELQPVFESPDGTLWRVTGVKTK